MISSTFIVEILKKSFVIIAPSVGDASTSDFKVVRRGTRSLLVGVRNCASAFWFLSVSSSFIFIQSVQLEVRLSREIRNAMNF